MGAIKRLVDFYLNSSIHVALAVCAMAYVTMLEFQLDVDFELLFFVGFASITGYNFVKYFGLAHFHHRSLATWLKYIQIFSLFCFIAMGYFAMQLQWHTLYVIGGLGIVTFFYAIPFLPKTLFLDQSKNLRAISGLKVYVIGMVWSVTTVVLPFVNQNGHLYFDVWIVLIQRFLIVLVLMLPFEIRDMKYDSLKLATIPQQIGVRHTKIIGIFMLLIVVVLQFFKDDYTIESTVILAVLFAILGSLVLYSKTEQSHYYSAFWVESIPIFWAILYFII